MPVTGGRDPEHGDDLCPANLGPVEIAGVPDHEPVVEVVDLRGFAALIEDQRAPTEFQHVPLADSRSPHGFVVEEPRKVAARGELGDGVPEVLGIVDRRPPLLTHSGTYLRRIGLRRPLDGCLAISASTMRSISGSIGRTDIIEM